MDATAMPSPGRRPLSASKRLLALRGDAALAARVRAGDAAAFEVLYERHVGGILSFCRHMLGSPEEAEDAVQNVFVAANRRMLIDERELNLKPWLYAVARNRCLSVLRARREDASDEIEVSTRGLAEVVQQRADLRSLLGDLQDLPDQQRAALVLSELGDLSHAEVAEALGCEAGQVKGLVFRARAGLAERREAREASCEEIRIELANARGGGFRRGRLAHHVKACPACAAFRDDLRRQRRMLGLILPVTPTVGLKSCVLGALGGGGGAAGGAAAVSGGVAASTGAFGGGAVSVLTVSVTKVAAVAVIASGAGVAIVTGQADPGPPPVSREAPQAAPANPDRGAGHVTTGSRQPAGPRHPFAREQALPGPGRRPGRSRRSEGLNDDRGGAGTGRGHDNRRAGIPNQIRGGTGAPGRRGESGRGRGATGKPAEPPGRAERPAAPRPTVPRRPDTRPLPAGGRAGGSPPASDVVRARPGKRLARGRPAPAEPVPPARGKPER